MLWPPQRINHLHAVQLRRTKLHPSSWWNIRSEKLWNFTVTSEVHHCVGSWATKGFSLLLQVKLEWKKKKKKKEPKVSFFWVGGVVLDAVVSTSSWVMRPNQKQSTFSWEEYPLWHDWLHLPPRTLIRAACLSPSLTKLFFPSLTNFIRNFLSVVTSQRGSGARGGLEWEERHEADWIFSVEQGEGSIYRFGDVKHGHAQTCFISLGLMLGLMWVFFFHLMAVPF